MSKLESIVPPMELCKLIPAGEFKDSALVWVYDDVVGFLCRTSGCEQIHKKEWRLEHNHPRKIAIRRKSGHEIYPAPTLAEILAKIPAAINGVGVLELALDDRAENNDGRYVICYNRYGVDGALEETTQLESDNNSATAALRLWLRVRREDGR